MKRKKLGPIFTCRELSKCGLAVKVRPLLLKAKKEGNPISLKAIKPFLQERLKRNAFARKEAMHNLVGFLKDEKIPTTIQSPFANGQFKRKVPEVLHSHGVQTAISTEPDPKDLAGEDGISWYYRQIRRMKLPILEEGEVIALVRRIRKGSVAARNTLILHNLRLIAKLAWDFLGRGLDYLDLVQEGNIGLLRAAELYDPKRKTAFSTYAGMWAKQRKWRAIYNSGGIIREPVNVHEWRRLLFRATWDLATELHREPTVEEIAAKIKQDPEKVRRMLERRGIYVVSLQQTISDDEDSRTIGEETSQNEFLLPSDALEAKEKFQALRATIQRILSRLENFATINPKHKQWFLLRYGFDRDFEWRTLEEVGDVVGVTREMIRITCARIWRKFAKLGEEIYTPEMLEEQVRRLRVLQTFIHEDIALRSSIMLNGQFATDVPSELAEKLGVEVKKKPKTLTSFSELAKALELETEPEPDDGIVSILPSIRESKLAAAS